MIKVNGPATAEWPSLDVATSGSGPALVLLHGGTGSRNHWVRNIPELSQSFTIHAVDSPGFGDSPAAARDMDPDLYLDWVACAVKQLGDSVALAGFSFGGVVAAAVAARLGSRVNSLSLLGPGGFGVPKHRNIKMRRMPNPEAGDHARREVIAHNLGHWMLLHSPEPSDPVVDLHWENIRRARFDSRKLSFRDTTVADIANARCPVQVIWGAEDPLATPSIDARADRIAEARPDVEFHRVPKAGHWVQYEMPAAVNEILTAFHSLEK